MKWFSVLVLLLVCSVCYASDVSMERVVNDIWIDDKDSIRVSDDAGLVLNTVFSASTNTIGVLDYNINNSYDSVKKSIRVKVSPDTSIITGRCTIDAGATANSKALTADSVKVSSVILRAIPTNRTNVYIGTNAASFTSQTGFIVTKDDVITIPIDDLSDIYIRADVAGEGVTWIGVKP